MTADAVLMLLPEITLAAAGVLIYLGGAFWPARRGWDLFAAAAILAAAVVLDQQSAAGITRGPLYGDQFALFVRWLALAFGALLTLAASARGAAPEYVGSLLLTVAGAMLVAAADDLILLFAALELISIPTYVLLYLGRRDAEGREAATKYFFLSVFASAILLYGFSFLYGVGGSTDLSAIQAILSTGQLPHGFGGALKAGLALTLGGLCFKVAAVPLHFYAPDVYQGTTHPNAALLSIVPKLAGLAAMTRIFAACAPPGVEQVWCWAMVLALAAATMTLGNVLGLWQDNLRRLMAYSSIAQTGYMLLALAAALAGGESAFGVGLAAMWFYFVVYALATLGTFAALEHLGGADRDLQGVDELAGLARSKPVAAAGLAACMFSLAGIPLLAGFWGKLLVFAAALGGDNAAGWWLTAGVIVAALNAAVAAAYYLRIVVAMYFRSSPAAVPAQGGGGPWLAALFSMAMVVVLGVYPGPLMNASRRADIKPPPQTAPPSGAAATTPCFADKRAVILDAFPCRRDAAIIVDSDDNVLSRSW